MKAVFLETSALLRYLLREEGAERVETTLKGSQTVVASRLLQVEARRAIHQIGAARAKPEQSLFQLEGIMESLWQKMDFYEVTAEICELAGKISPRSMLRSLDAIHLATYRSVLQSDPTTEILTFDRRILTELNESSPAL